MLPDEVNSFLPYTNGFRRFCAASLSSVSRGIYVASKRNKRCLMIYILSELTYSPSAPIPGGVYPTRI